MTKSNYCNDHSVFTTKNERPLGSLFAFLFFPANCHNRIIFAHPPLYDFAARLFLTACISDPPHTPITIPSQMPPYVGRGVMTSLPNSVTPDDGYNHHHQQHQGNNYDDDWQDDEQHRVDSGSFLRRDRAPIHSAKSRKSLEQLLVSPKNTFLIFIKKIRNIFTVFPFFSKIGLHNFPL